VSHRVIERASPRGPRVAYHGGVQRSLRRVVGLAFGVSVIVGGTIGTGVLRLPQTIAAVGDGATYLAVWLAGGVYALVCAPSFAELGAMSERSGGLYVFVRRALGDRAGFVVGLSDWVSFAGTIASLALFVAELVARLGGVGAGAEIAIAVALVLGFAALQLLGLRAGSWTQIASSAIKAAVLVALAVAAAFHAPASAAGASPPAAPHGWGAVIAFAVAMKAIVFVYDGYYHVAYFAGELRDPGRDVPRAIFATLLSIIAIYLVLNLAYLHVLGIGTIAAEPFTGGAFAGALFGDAGDRVITAVMLVTALSTLSENFLAGPRILHAMSVDGLIPARAAAVSAGGTPTITVLVTAAGALAFVLSGTYERALAIVFFYVLANYALTFASVFALRRREPAAPRPYRAWGYPVTTALGLAVALALLAAAIVDDPLTAAIATGIFTVGLLARSIVLGSSRSRSTARGLAARSEDGRQQGNGKGSEPELSTDNEDEEGAR
jgi:basic amino acid/polyamine antiporter, APA family